MVVSKSLSTPPAMRSHAPIGKKNALIRTKSLVPTNSPKKEPLMRKHSNLTRTSSAAYSQPSPVVHNFDDTLIATSELSGGLKVTLTPPTVAQARTLPPSNSTEHLSLENRCHKTLRATLSDPNAHCKNVDNKPLLSGHVMIAKRLSDEDHFSNQSLVSSRSSPSLSDKVHEEPPPMSPGTRTHKKLDRQLSLKNSDDPRWQKRQLQLQQKQNAVDSSKVSLHKSLQASASVPTTGMNHIQEEGARYNEGRQTPDHIGSTPHAIIGADQRFRLSDHNTVSRVISSPVKLLYGGANERSQSPLLYSQSDNYVAQQQQMWSFNNQLGSATKPRTENRGEIAQPMRQRFHFNSQQMHQAVQQQQQMYRQMPMQAAPFQQYCYPQSHPYGQELAHSTSDLHRQHINMVAPPFGSLGKLPQTRQMQPPTQPQTNQQPNEREKLYQKLSPLFDPAQVIQTLSQCPLESEAKVLANYLIKKTGSELLQIKSQASDQTSERYKTYNNLCQLFSPDEVLNVMSQNPLVADGKQLCSFLLQLVPNPHEADLFSTLRV